MKPSPGPLPGGESIAGIFPTTHWSVVLAAGKGAPPDAAAALNHLCETYWYPLYAHARRKGNDPEKARDLTQSFFADLLERRSYEKADRDRGRFRSFLCRSLENFLHHEHERATAVKRGGGREILSWDAEQAEGRFLKEPQTDATPETAYQRSWAQTLIEQAFTRLRNEFAVGGREEFFDRIRPHLWQDDDATPYADLARQFSMTVVSVRVTVHRLRKRYGEVLRAEIAQTVSSPGEVEDELNELIRALAEP